MGEQGDEQPVLLPNKLLSDDASRFPHHRVGPPHLHQRVNLSRLAFGT